MVCFIEFTPDIEGNYYILWFTAIFHQLFGLSRVFMNKKYNFEVNWIKIHKISDLKAQAQQGYYTTLSHFSLFTTLFLEILWFLN